MPVLKPGTLRLILQIACGGIGLSLVLVVVRLPLLAPVLVLVFLAWRKRQGWASSGWSHGTARLAGLADLVRHRLLGDDGLILGTTELLGRPSVQDAIFALYTYSSAEWACRIFLSILGGMRWTASRLIRIGDFTHLATFAPTGRGKGVSVLVPNLLSYRGSCVVTDPKGELYTLTAGHRNRRFGHRIIRLDPFGVCGPGTDCFNPLHCIDDAAPDFLDQCRDLADMIVMQTGKEPDPYWNDSARSVITAFIAFVCACEEEPQMRTLDNVRDLLSSRDSYAKSVEIMQRVETHGGVIKRLGHGLTWHVDRELGSVLANVQRHTEFLDSPVLAYQMQGSTFNPLWLRSGPATIYICLPHDRLETLAPLMRLWIGSILRYITRGRPSEANPVLFLLDEAAHLGKIRVLEQAVTLMRGMGIRLWFFFQSPHQMMETFGEKAKTILDNIDTQQYFAVNEYESAEALSKRIGEATIGITSRGENASESSQGGESSQRSRSVTRGWNTNHSDIGRRLFKPEELLTLPEDMALVFHRNMPVIPARLVRYFSHPLFCHGGTGLQPGLDGKATEKALGLLILGIGSVLAALSLPTAAEWRERTPSARSTASSDAPPSARRFVPPPARVPSTGVPGRPARTSPPTGLRPPAVPDEQRGHLYPLARPGERSYPIPRKGDFAWPTIRPGNP